jgi:uncharacterized membrane protein YhiD involved in acid resistance
MEFPKPNKATFLKVGQFTFYTAITIITVINSGVLNKVSNSVNQSVIIHDKKLEKTIIDSINSNIDYSNMVILNYIDSVRSENYKENDRTRKALRKHIISTEKDSKKLNDFLDLIYVSNNLQSVHDRRNIKLKKGDAY